MDSVRSIYGGHVRWLVVIPNKLQNPYESGMYCVSNNEFTQFSNNSQLILMNLWLNFQSTVVIGWFSSSFCLLWIVYGLYNVELSPLAAAAFSSLSHTAWALSLAWIVVACSTGYGGYVNKLLSAPIIYPFSRVTYCAYLVHPISIRFISLGSDATIHLGNDSMVSIHLPRCETSWLKF